MGDMCTCVGPPDSIILGSSGVFIGGKPAARMGDMTTHGGSIAVGLPTVLIGETGSGGSGGGSAGSAGGAAGSTGGSGAKQGSSVLAVNKTQQPEEEQDPKKHWIKFRVVDKDNNPLEKVVLRVKLPDGSSVERTTDKNGLIEIKNIEPGNCKLETYWDGCALGDTLFIK
jgi:hypothetical protein